MDEIKQSWVTFCISTFKRATFLKSTLQSIKAQTFPHFEVVVSDNDIEQSAKSVIEEMNDVRFKYYCNEENFGMIKSFNKSIERATTEFIVMIADDDPVYPNMLETLHTLYITYPGYGVYHGGCDVIINTVNLAKEMRSKVGNNSCLSNEMDIGAVKVYSATEFPALFFDNKVNNYMLWSVGVVRKEILQKIGYIPDYGTPFMGDLCYTLLTCSDSGVVFSNTSLGCQVVHGTNYGFALNGDYNKFYITADGFYNWTKNRLSFRKDWDTLKPKMERFIARWIIGYAIATRKHLDTVQQNKTEFIKTLKQLFKISYIKKWQFKYYVAIYFPNLFELLLEIKKRYL